VWSAQPPEISQTYVKDGKTKSTPEWFTFDSETKKVSQMIHLLFESARVTHPNCRLVILTDMDTKFTNAVDPGVAGPKVELVRNKGLDVQEGMISRMKARTRFLTEEFRKGSTHNLVFLDTDMLITRPLDNVFFHNYDVAATWREDKEMPVNGGILFVKKENTNKGMQFFENMLDITLRQQSVLRRWFGMSDQVSLAKLMDKDYGYKGKHPSTGKLEENIALRFTFKDPKKKILFNIVLLSCYIFNGTGEKDGKDRKCKKLGCCCSEASHVLHFKGSLKEGIYTYWKDSCNNRKMYRCATLQQMCNKVKANGRRRRYY